MDLSFKEIHFGTKKFGVKISGFVPEQLQLLRTGCTSLAMGWMWLPRRTDLKRFFRLGFVRFTFESNFIVLSIVKLKNFILQQKF